ncbi:hypothetical protein F5X98DRAFT_374019 [Xylaria grammica]|nr:hypothetical protein F5X98DRAFT_374019 [Xylaria grammica]
MKLSRATLILASLARVRGQDLNSTIVGCIEVGCPASSAIPTSDDCAVADESFDAVGLVRVPTTQKTLNGLSWTKGVNIAELPGNKTSRSVFYLGTPLDLNLKDSGACSVFLHGLSPTLSFGGENGNQETANGQCADAMGSDCVNALLDRARAFVKGSDNNSISGADLCSALQDNLSKNITGACPHLSDRPWTKMSSTALTGSHSPQPISAKENATSTCWPVLPKEHRLTYVTDYVVRITDFSVHDIQALSFAITPILTVFYPTGSGSGIDDVDASLTCVKIMGPSRASFENMRDGSGKGSAISLSPSSTMLITMGALLLGIALGI